MMGGIQEEVSEVISPFGRSSRVAEGPQLPRTDCLLSVPRKAGKTSDTVTFSPVARSREPGSQRKFPTQVSKYLFLCQQFKLRHNVAKPASQALHQDPTLWQKKLSRCKRGQMK